MRTRIGNLTIQISDDDPPELRPQAESSDSDSGSHTDSVSVFLAADALRVQLMGSPDALRALAHGIVNAADTIEQRKLATALPAGQPF